MNRGEPNSDPAPSFSTVNESRSPAEAIAPDVGKLLEKIIDATHSAGRNSFETDDSIRQLARVVTESGKAELHLAGLEKLVGMALEDYVADAGLSGALAQQLAASVSHAMFDDPAARVRLERLWSSLMELQS